MKDFTTELRAAAVLSGLAASAVLLAMPAPVSAQENGGAVEDGDGQRIVHTAAVGHDFCALRANGESVCYAAGYRDMIEALAFEGEPLLRDIDSGDGGGYAIDVCGVRTDGTLICDSEHHGLEVVPEGRFEAVAVGEQFACALDGGRRLTCWGAGVDAFKTHADQQPDLVAKLQLDPQRWAPRGEFDSVTAAGKWACGVEDSGATSCWSFARTHASRMRHPTAFEQVEMAASHDGSLRACGIIKETRKIACWGFDDRTRYDLDSLRGAYIDLAHTGNELCAVDAKGAVDCTGYEGNSSPAFEQSMRDIVLGKHIACGVDAFDDLYCWRNEGGQKSEPQRVGE